MGTGKTTIGTMLAEKLGRDFIDMDDEIVAHFGKPIPEVFKEEGEAVFRQVESEICQKLAERENLVISTGGGAVVNQLNRETLAQSGILICLTASADEIAERVEPIGDRPVLGADESTFRERINSVLQERAPAYGAIQHQVNTTGLTPEAVLTRVQAIIEADQEVDGMNRIVVPSPEGEYDICIGEGLLEHVGQLLLNRGLRPGGAAVVTNEMVSVHYGDQLCASLKEAGFEPIVCHVPEGEEHKTLATIATLYDQFLAAGLDRNSPVISLGGGVVGDMTGFAAATYLRGTPFVQIPTSLLAMVDASVGGKTGVDMPQGKNLVGAFKQPALVVIDVDVMKTLSPRQFRCGLAEIIKHGIIADPQLFEQLETHGPSSLTQLVTDAVKVKVKVVEEDPFEQGRRAVLNLGHTFGHAIEWVSELSLGHGEAIAVGLVAAAHLAESMERCSPELVQRIINVLEKVELPTYVTDYEVDAIMNAMWFDKKRKGKTLRFIIPQDLGDVVIIDDPGEELVRAAVAKVVR